jgi:hypothetical protein
MIHNPMSDDLMIDSQMSRDQCHVPMSDVPTSREMVSHDPISDGQMSRNLMSDFPMDQLPYASSRRLAASPCAM